MIKVEQIYKSYLLLKHDVTVLMGASLEIGTDQSVAIVGRSGAGKSTLLHILGGLDRPDKGRVFMDGEDIYELSNKRRTRIRCESIGFVFQHYHLLPEMDVLENVMLPGMAMGGRTRRKLRRDALDLLDVVGLADRSLHRPQELSGGEQQRVALARALVNNPKAIMADEPTGNLDADTGGQVLDHVFRIARERGSMLVMVTHDEKIAGRCDAVYRLEEGKIKKLI